MPFSVRIARIVVKVGERAEGTPHRGRYVFFEDGFLYRRLGFLGYLSDVREGPFGLRLGLLDFGLGVLLGQRGLLLENGHRVGEEGRGHNRYNEGQGGQGGFPAGVKFDVQISPDAGKPARPWRTISALARLVQHGVSNLRRTRQIWEGV